MSDADSDERGYATGGEIERDPAHQRATADAIVQRAADQLRQQLERLARAIDPFPAFPGAMFAYGIEVTPPAALAGDGVEDAPGCAAPGCVVLGDDGALYELQIGIDPAQVALGGDHVAARHEELVPLELPPAVYVAYARQAVLAAAAHLEGQPLS